MDTKKAMAEELAEMLADAHATGFAEAIETIARHFEKHYRDYVWCRVAVEGIRTLAPATTKPK